MKKDLILFCIGFLFLLSFSLIGLNNPTTPTNFENRVLAGKPIFYANDMKQFFIDYTSYFDDNFGYRQNLISLDSLIKYKIFASSPEKDVTIGKNNWLFYTPDDTYLDTLNAQPFSDGDLSTIKQNLEKTNNFFVSQNIHFYFLVAPNSQTIYPEFLPSSFKKMYPTSRLEQITSYLNSNHAKIVFINPTPQLLQAKSKNQLYYHYDTHWNQMGAFIVYQLLFQKIAQDFPTLSPSKITDFSISERPTKHDDLSELIGLNNNLTENEIDFEPKNKQPLQLTESVCPNEFTSCPYLNYQNPSANFNLVFYRDSFGTNLIPFMAPQFKNSFYIWKEKPLSLDIVNEQKPQIVIFEITERELWRLTDPIFIFPNH